MSMTPEEFVDSSDFARLLSRAADEEARRIEPWAWAIAIPTVALVVVGVWQLVSWAVSL